ncbi:MAG: F0F1 ATP synthase subunit delta [Bacillota bacterium]|nr:F0F1 ATP synthase subunit delta [Bacillota bacterium]
MYEYLDRRYASALYEVAENRGRVKEYLETLKQISEIICINEGIFEILKSPNISTQKKKKIFIELFKGKIDSELLAFLLILIDKNRILYLKEKVVEMEKIQLEKEGMLIAEVKTVIPLDHKERNALKTKLETRYNKNIILNEEIDTGIIGGVWVRIGSDIIDGTIKSRLHEIKEAAIRTKWR